MKMSKVELSAALMALVVAATTLTLPAFADTSAQSGQAVAFLAQPPIGMTNATASYLVVQFQNQSLTAINGTVYAVLRNAMGETVAISAAPFANVTAGQNATAPLALNVPFDAYNVYVFAVNSAGFAISADTNSTVVA
ncbi:MAG TPA: hypothetical protein VLX56_04535 [Nitrososphaerales archaeon]|nr:hypothetical protein [Nitrososphaerales archaeon]